MDKYYICTAIPYVNGQLHLGHAILHIYADALARYHRQLGDDVLYSAGTDEHGGKIAEVAEKAGIAPKKYVEEISASFKKGLKTLGVSNDKFIRTTDLEHEKIAKIIWKNLKDDIYKNSYVGLYCVGCEEFKTDAYVKETNGICPLHNRKYEKVEEENYFFKLSKYQDKIKKAIESGEFEIRPKSRRNEVLGVLKEGLDDISISRRADKIAWGIPVPGDKTQVMYVWFEALMNYITVLGYPDGADFKKFWPADTQVIGKDILRFHAAIWPAMLLGLGLPLPKILYAHGFITNEGQKMSKSLGNVVDPTQIVKQYGQDALRYYLFRYGPVVSDVDFSWSKFVEAYNNELANELGNGVQRVASMVNNYLGGTLGKIEEKSHDSGLYDEAMTEYRWDKALDSIWDQVRGLNQYIEEEKPWAVAKNGDKEELKSILSEAVGSLLEISELLVPFLPQTAEKINEVFLADIILPPEEMLFPRIDII